jgi:hypothetical protein
VTKLIFVTPVGVTNLTGEAWVTDIHKEFGYDLAIMSREDIITSLMDPANASLPQSQLGLQVPIEGPEAETIEKIRAATADVASAWFARLPSRHLLEPRARQLDRDGRDTGEV